jgi:hypothetical protein
MRRRSFACGEGIAVAAAFKLFSSALARREQSVAFALEPPLSKLGGGSTRENWVGSAIRNYDDTALSELS